MARDFAGRVVVVTGAAGGLGRALVDAFAAAGAQVAALDRDAALLRQADFAAAAVRRLVCDVADEADCRRALAEVRDAWGGIDVLVNNAGITHRSAFAATRPEVIRRVMAVNFFGALHCTHAALDACSR